MGRGYPNHRETDTDCCRTNWSSLFMYFLVFLALTLSVLNFFWFSLYRYEELRHELYLVREEQNKTLDKLYQLQNDSQRLRNDQDLLRGEIKAKLKEMRKYSGQSFMSSGEETEEMSLIREIKETHGKVINSLRQKVIGFEDHNEVTLLALAKLQKAMADLHRIVNGQKDTVDRIENLATESSNQADAVTETIRDHNASIMKLGGETKTLQAAIDTDRAIQRSIETQFRDVLDDRQNFLNHVIDTTKKVKGINDRINDVEQTQRQTRKDIERLVNASQYSEAAISQLHVEVGQVNASLRKDHQESADTRAMSQKFELKSNAQKQQEELEHVQNRVNWVSDALTYLNSTVSLSNGNHERRMVVLNEKLDSMVAQDQTFERRIDRLNNKVEHFKRNVLKMRKLPGEINDLQQRLKHLEKE